MDPYEDAPLVASIAANYAFVNEPPPSTPVTLPPLTSGTETFESIEAVMERVRELHQVLDPDVAPHRSKYAARIIMTDILSLLTPLRTSVDLDDSGRQWINEQIGRIEYLNGVNHIEAEETSAGEKMLNKSLLKFHVNAISYPFDVLDGFNQLAIVWSNRSQHGVAHAYLQHAQNAFLRFKKLRNAAKELLTEEERRIIAEEDQRHQLEEAVDPDAAITEEKTEESHVDVPSAFSLAASPAASHAGGRFLIPSFWHSLEVTHTLTLFFLAQVFGHLKKRDLAAVYCHLTLNRQLKQRKDFQRVDWVTNAIGLSFYYSGRKLFQQAHHCLLAAQSFVKASDIPKKMNTPQTDTSRDDQLAADLCRAWGAFYLKWLQRSRDLYIESEALPTLSNAPLTQSDEALAASVQATTSTANSVTGATIAPPAAAPKPDAADAADPTSSLASLPIEELRELKRLQRLDREHERHFDNRIEDDADEEEDDLFGDLNKARKFKSPEQLAKEAAEPPKDRTLPTSLTKEEQEAVQEELKKNEEEDLPAAPPAASSSAPSPAASVASSSTDAASLASSFPSDASSSSTHLFIEFKSLNLPPSPRCVPATSFVAARTLFKLSLEWFTRSSWFYILDGYVSDHIPIQQDISLLYKLLAVFDLDLSRQCKMHKRRIDLLTPIYSQLSVASYQEFYQQLTDEIASTYAEMVELKQLILQMKVRILGKKFPEKKRDDAQQKLNELSLNAIKFYSIWLQSWSKDGKEVEILDEYYHRCYSKIYHSDPVILNQFVKKAYDQYRAVIAKALAWNAVHVMPEELTLCKEMVDLLPHKMDRVAQGSKEWINKFNNAK